MRQILSPSSERKAYFLHELLAFHSFSLHSRYFANSAAVYIEACAAIIRVDSYSWYMMHFLVHHVFLRRSRFLDGR
jgi:hypothetical protein